MREASAEWYAANREHAQAKRREWKSANADLNKEINKAYWRGKREWNAERMARLRKEQPEHMRALGRASDARRRMKAGFRVNSAISRRLRENLARGKQGRKWPEVFGYSLAELCTHLERQFLKGMTWENYGTAWHIDHILPLSSFTITSIEDPEVRRAWALTNLRPLWARDNQQKWARVTTLL